MKKTRKTKFKDESPIDFLLIREGHGMGRYRKTLKRDDEKRRVLIELAIKKMEEKEKDDFIPLGTRKRRIKIE